MKKVLFIMMMLVCMTASVSARSWAQLGPMWAESIEDMSGQMSQMFKAQGIPATVSSGYSTANKSVDLTVDFGSLDIIPYLDNSIMDEVKRSFIASMIQSVKDEDNVSLFNEMTDAMKKDGGTIRITFTGAGQQKSVSVTGEELKKAMNN